MWSLTVLQRHALYGDYRVTEGCWVECESQVPAGGVDRVWEGCVGSLVVDVRVTNIIFHTSVY